MTFRLSFEREQMPYVLKQGSPDMSCVPMTTCNRKDENHGHRLTESCKCVDIWGTGVLLQDGIYTGSNMQKIHCH